MQGIVLTNVPPTMDEHGVRAILEKFAPPVKIICTRLPDGTGIVAVQMPSRESSNAALAALDRAEVDGVRLRARTLPLRDAEAIFDGQGPTPR